MNMWDSITTYDREEIRKAERKMMLETMDEFYRQFQERQSTSFYQHVLVGGDLPIRLKNQQPPARRLADFLT